MIDEKHNIIPIRANEKRPALEHVSDWYDTVFPKEKLKNAKNFAVICGATSQNLVVLDLDYAKPMNYITDIYPKLNTELGQIINTYTEHSPNGAHLFFYLEGYIPPSKTNTNSDIGDMRDIINKYVNGKTKTLRGLVKVIKTIEPDKYHSIDILASKKYCIIHPSTIDGKSYDKGLPFPIKRITTEEFENLIAFFLLKTPSKSRMRKPFVDLLEGKIEIESFAKENGVDEHVYWSGLFKEAYNFLGLLPEDIYPLLRLNQPAFDIEKTEQQLNSGSHNYDDKPLKNDTLKEYFPSYSPRRPTIKRKDGEKPIYIQIADRLMEKYDIVTIRGQKEAMLIRKGNTYSTNLNDFYFDLAREIEYHEKSITHLSSNVEKRIKYLTYFDADSLCYENWLISFKNGYYDITTNIFYTTDENTDKAFCYEIPHDYNPKYKGGCPEYIKMLKEWLEYAKPITKEDIFEMIGYTMIMNTDMKMAFFIYGESGTGKTQFQNILEYVIGHQNRCAVSLQRMSHDQFGTQGMQFKILNMVGDMSGLSVNDVSKFKELTGGDRYVGAEEKGGKQHEFRNIIKIWLNGNDIPILDDDDNAFYIRWILIPFEKVFEMYGDDTVKDIGEKLCENENEIQGIIHEAINGLKRLYKRQYFRKEIIQNTKHTWRYKAEPLYAFLYDNFTKDEDSTVSSYDFRMRYNKYLYKIGKRPTSAHNLNNMMEKHGIYHDRIMVDGMREERYLGIKKKKYSDGREQQYMIQWDDGHFNG